MFILTGAIETTGLSTELFKTFGAVVKGGVPALSAITAVLSNLVSNVPAVLLFRPEIPNLANPQQGWLTLAMASTLVGSVANLIIAEVAAYARVGVPLTIITLILGAIWLSLIG